MAWALSRSCLGLHLEEKVLRFPPCPRFLFVRAGLAGHVLILVEEGLRSWL